MSNEDILGTPKCLRKKMAVASDELRESKEQLVNKAKRYKDLCDLYSTTKWEKVKLVETLRNLESQESRIQGTIQIFDYYYRSHPGTPSPC